MQRSFPASREELRERIIEDPVFFLETCCLVRDYRGRGLVPFVLNRPQRRYVEEIWLAHPTRDIVGKSRKWGFTTLRAGLALHEVLFRVGRSARLVAQRRETALEVAKTVRLLFESARAFFELAREPWRYYLPEATSESVFGYEFAGLRSSIRVDTASGRGVGRSDRYDDVYCIEFSEWEASTAEESLNNLLTSQPAGSESCRFTVDFNARTNWASHHCFGVWTNAWKDGDDWNGFTPFFSGTGDLPEIYTREFLAERLRVLGAKRFRLDYPERPEDLLVQRDQCVFDGDLVDQALARSGGRYLVDVLGGIPQRVIHGVDTATGLSDGDWQVCVSFGWHDGMWWELCEPIRCKVPEDVFAERVDERARRFPGITVVERNVGSAVLTRLRELGTPRLYRHKHRDRTGKQRRQLGFPTTYATKRAMIAGFDRMLREGSIALVTPGLAEEIREFEWKTDREGKESHGLAGAPDRAGAHDDMVMAAMLALEGQNYEYQPAVQVAAM